METIGTPWMWFGFFAFVIAMLLVDLFLLGGRKAHKVSIKEAAIWSVVWVTIALLFNAALWWYLQQMVGREVADTKALEFFTGYLVEKSLAVDNVFVWLMLFSYFAVPPEYQRRVLLYGVLGALVMRTMMILLGAWLLAHFHWILYVFGAFLVFTGIKMLWFSEHQSDLEQNPLVRWLRGHMRVTTYFHQERFFVMQDRVVGQTCILA
jgi:tellurite resistance protein TerC